MKLDPTASPFHFYSHAEVIALMEQEVSWRIKGLLPTYGIVLLSGDPYTGKSRLSAAMAASVVTGKPFAGLDVSKGRVVFAALEHSLGSVGRLLVSAARGVGLKELPEADFVVLRPPLDLGNDATAQLLRDQLDLFGADVVFLDSLRRLGTFDENDATQVSRVMRNLQLLADEKRCIVVLHHLSKQGRQPRGSTDLLAGSDTHFSVRRDQDALSIQVEHHEAEPWSGYVALLEAGGALQALAMSREEMQDATEADVGGAVLEFLGQHPEGATKSEVRASLKGDNHKVDLALWKLCKDGTVMKKRDGHSIRYWRNDNATK
jgi:RecA-family ATPase